MKDDLVIFCKSSKLQTVCKILNLSGILKTPSTFSGLTDYFNLNRAQLTHF